MTDMTRKKRDAKNLGGTIGINRELPSPSAARTNVVNIERLLVALLKAEVERFSAEPELLRMFFAHMFDPLVGETEREEFVTNFTRLPPEVVLGYPRTSTQFPCFAIILQEDSEDQNFIGDFAGETEDDEEGLGVDEYKEYAGVLCNSSFGIYIYAQHPDVCLYLYYFAKMIVFGAKPLFLSNGMTEVNISGGEVAPDEQYLPDNMFMRTLTVSGQSMFTVPQFALVNRRRLRLLGLYRDDVVVDGVQGGITPTRSDDDDDT
jgi:hypothetical protein